jgi:hypothetical protein
VDTELCVHIQQRRNRSIARVPWRKSLFVLGVVVGVACCASVIAADVNLYRLPYSLLDESARPTQLRRWRGRPTLVTMDSYTADIERFLE